MSDSTWGWSHWPTSSGPRSPAASVAKRRPSTSRAPRATGSTASRAHARSRNDRAGSTSTSTRSSATQQLDGALGDDRRAGHRVEHLAVLGGGGHQRLDDGGVDLVEGVARRRRGRRRLAASGTATAAGWRLVRRKRCGDGVDAREGAGGEQVGPGRPEADDDDPGPAHRVRARRAGRRSGRRPAPRAGRTRPVARSQVP